MTRVEAGSAYVMRPVGRVESSLTRREQAPMQGSEGAPAAWIVFGDAFRDAMGALRPGDRLVVLTWLHEADREIQLVHPRDDPTVPETGVFSTRSPDRPNPIGLHPVEVVEVDGLRVLVEPLEAIDGTPVLDVKPALRSRA
jgi:tRNA-Thr(GGU) m(6)t(6)A37 methyltransferase TsaA